MALSTLGPKSESFKIQTLTKLLWQSDRALTDACASDRKVIYVCQIIVSLTRSVTIPGQEVDMTLSSPTGLRQASVILSLTGMLSLCIFVCQMCQCYMGSQLTPCRKVTSLLKS
jgi:hypothetical protein